jgi:DHA1 family bicyclomycin/chloramphenicol resistance-like MFS transporter
MSIALPANKPATLLLTLLLALMSTLGPFAIDTYLPSFHAIEQDLHATPFQLQQTLSFFLGASAFMGLFHGALSDSFGRRKVVLTGLVVFAIASVGCALATSIGVLLFFRALQGMSSGVGMIVGRAIIRDTQSGAEAQRMMSMVTMIFGFAPAVAPIIGGYLHTAFGWHSVFWFITAFSLFVWVMSALYLPESLPQDKRQPFHAAPLLRNYYKVMKSRKFLLLSLASAFNFSAFFLYIVSAPAFVLKLLKLSETQFAWLFIPTISGMIIGAFISGRIAGKYAFNQVVNMGFVVMMVAAVINVSYNYFVTQMTLPWAVLPLMLFNIGLQLTLPVVSILIMDIFPANRGLASSLQASISVLLMGIVAGTLSALVAHSGLWMALSQAALMSVGFVCWWIYTQMASKQAA